LEKRIIWLFDKEEVMLELKDFVSESLKQIIDGVSEAQEYAKIKGAKVNPRGLRSTGEARVGGTGGVHATKIVFDIAVAAETSDQVEGFNISVLGVFQGGVEGTEGTVSSQASRISFPVYVSLPVANDL
jgi:hypothetical protein